MHLLTFAEKLNLRTDRGIEYLIYFLWSLEGVGSGDTS